MGDGWRRDLYRRDPLTQSAFLLEVLKECREMQIHTAVETSACFPEKTFLEVMDYIQFAFIDVKIWTEKSIKKAPEYITIRSFPISGR